MANLTAMPFRCGEGETASVHAAAAFPLRRWGRPAWPKTRFRRASVALPGFPLPERPRRGTGIHSERWLPAPLGCWGCPAAGPPEVDGLGDVQSAKGVSAQSWGFLCQQRSEMKSRLSGPNRPAQKGNFKP